MGTAALLGVAPRALAAAEHTISSDPTGGQIEPTAGTWKTWVLSSGRQLQIAPPPGQATTASEITQLHAMAAQRDAAALNLIRYWDTGSPGYRWNEIAIEQGVKAGITMRSYRILALVNVAIYDATVAAWNAKYRYNRPRPSTVSPTLTTVLPTPASPAYPCEHAVAAGAASTVLAYLFPTQAQFFAAKAAEAGRSRLLAGVQYPSDVAAALDLGRRVGKMVVEWAKADGSDAKWTGTVPVGRACGMGRRSSRRWGTGRPGCSRPGVSSGLPHRRPIILLSGPGR
jgi:membrane-associated phospholipid phosphatase